MLLERNKHVLAARELKGEPLLPNEIAAFLSSFHVFFWNNLQGRSVYIQAYQAWREGGDELAAQRPSYELSWGGGCYRSPLSAYDLWRHHQDVGWPSVESVIDRDGGEAMAPGGSAEDSARCAAASAFALWALGCSARSVSMAKHGADVAKAKIIEKGLYNTMESLTKEVADSGEVVWLLRATSQDEVVTSIVVQLVGTCYSPKVFDAARHSWLQAADEQASPLAFPCICVLRVRECKAVKHFEACDAQTSSEFVLELAIKFTAIELSRAEYLTIEVDGSLMHIQLTGATPVGQLWQVGMTTPLAHDAAHRQRARYAAARAVLKALQKTDPLDPSTATNAAANKARHRDGAQRSSAKAKPPPPEGTVAGGRVEPEPFRGEQDHGEVPAAEVGNEEQGIALVVANEIDVAERDGDDLAKAAMQELDEAFAKLASEEEPPPAVADGLADAGMLGLPATVAMWRPSPARSVMLPLHSACL